MPEVKVLSVGSAKDWTGDHGTFRIYSVEYESGLSGALPGQIKKKADSPAPQVGESFDAQIVDKGAFPVELKRVQTNGAPSNGLSGGRTPEDRKSIIRQHSQHMAILWARELREGGMWPSDATGEQRRTALKALVDWFAADAEDQS